MSDNKIKKRITFYQMNHETKVPELQVLDAAVKLISGGQSTLLSVEDFVRSAALDTAARIVLADMKRRQAASTSDPSMTDPQPEGPVQDMKMKRAAAEAAQPRAQEPAVPAGQDEDYTNGESTPEQQQAALQPPTEDEREAEALAAEYDTAPR